LALIGSPQPADESTRAREGFRFRPLTVFSAQFCTEIGPEALVDGFPLVGLLAFGVVRPEFIPVSQKWEKRAEFGPQGRGWKAAARNSFAGGVIANARCGAAISHNRGWSSPRAGRFWALRS